MNRLKMIELRQLIYLPALCIVLVLSGCAEKDGPVMETSLKLPYSFSRSGTTELSGEWWLTFNDETLNGLIEQSLSNNFSLKSSWARLSLANAVYSKSKASLFPVFELDGSGSHSRDRSNGTSSKSDSISLGLSSSYEVDLWGRIDSEIDAARFDMEATAADLDAAAMTLVSQVASTWYQLIRQAVSLKLYDKQIHTNTTALNLITAQFRTGQVPLADVLQQRQLIENQKGVKVTLLSEKKQTMHRLAILLGQVPGTQTFQIPAQINDLPVLPKSGIPAELIRSRPDLRSAFLTLQAADQRVAEAVANQYPSLRLTASLSTINSPTSSIFSDYLASIMAGLTAPLFDGGLRKAEVERTKGVTKQLLNDYGQAIITALGEVEDTLVMEEKQQQYIQSLQGQLDLATQTMDQVKERYLKGVENYQRVLTALVSLQSLQQKMITARTDLLLNRIELCKALGTGWEYSKTDFNI